MIKVKSGKMKISRGSELDARIMEIGIFYQLRVISPFFSFNFLYNIIKTG